MKYIIDDLVNTNTQVQVGSIKYWFISKPFEYWTVDRFKRAWDVFIGKARAVYFVEDERKN